MINNISTNHVSIGFAIRASQYSKTALPVSRANYIYSHFRHVSGVLAPEGNRGVAVNKLKILDTLIERLNQLRKLESYPMKSKEVNEDKLDLLIQQAESQIRDALRKSASMIYTVVPVAQTGMIFDLVA